MVGNEDDQYVLAMLLPWHMPWSEEEQGMTFWHWVEKVFSVDDAWNLWSFMPEDFFMMRQGASSKTST